MIWQDIVLGAVQWGFALALIPSIIGQDKPALLTSALTAAGLFTLAATVTTLGLWLGAASAATCGLGWAVLAYQAWRPLAFRARRRPYVDPVNELLYGDNSPEPRGFGLRHFLPEEQK